MNTPHDRTPASSAARDPRGVGNGPVAGRFVLFEPQDDGEFYVTSWDTWEEAGAAFPIPADLVLRDDETGRVWRSGFAREWEAAQTLTAAQGRPKSLGEATGPTGRGEAGGQKPSAAQPQRDPFADDVLERLIASNQDYQREHGHYIVPLAERLLAARAELARVREIHRAEQRASADRLRECLEKR